MEEDLKFSELAQFQDKQLEARRMLFKEDTKYLLYGGAAGGGKSYFVRWEALELGLFYAQKYGIQGIPIGLFSEDYPSLRDRQITKIKREFPPWLGEIKETKDEGLCFFIKPAYGGAVIMLRNLDDPSKYASVEFAAILVEELTKNKEETFEDLRTRMRFPGIEDRKFVGATNPGQVGHGWVKKKWIKLDPNDLDEEQSKFKFVKAVYSDNKYNPSDYVNQLRAIKNPEKRKALLEGSWDVFAGQVFEEWNEKIHTCPAFIEPKDYVKYGGMDWGRAKPFAFEGAILEKVYLEGIEPFNRLWVYYEAYGTNRRPQDWGKQIKEEVDLSEYRSVRGDPSIFHKKDDGSQSIADDIKDEWGMYGNRLEAANNDRLGGWEIVHKWLSLAPDGKPYMIISRRCPNLIRTLPDLVYDNLKFEDVDSDTEDHAPDALRYMVVHVPWIDARSEVVQVESTNVRDFGRDSFIVKEGTIPSIDIKSFIGEPERDWTRD